MCESRYWKGLLKCSFYCCRYIWHISVGHLWKTLRHHAPPPKKKRNCEHKQKFKIRKTRRTTTSINKLLCDHGGTNLCSFSVTAPCRKFMSYHLCQCVGIKRCVSISNQIPEIFVFFYFSRWLLQPIDLLFGIIIDCKKLVSFLVCKTWGSNSQTQYLTRGSLVNLVYFSLARFGLV